MTKNIIKVVHYIPIETILKLLSPLSCFPVLVLYLFEKQNNLKENSSISHFESIF